MALPARRLQVTIKSSEAGKSLLTFLSDRFPYHTIAQWRSLILAGRILIDDKSVQSPETELPHRATVEYLAGAYPEPNVEKSYRILFERDGIVFLDKPANLPCHPAGPYYAHTLWALLKQAGWDKTHFISRLDRETSGLIVTSHDSAVARRLHKQIQNGAVHKRYLATVYGDFPDRMKASGCIEPDPHTKARKKQRFVNKQNVLSKSAKRVYTELRCLTKSAGYSLIEAVPQTGRFHQIRATLRGLGYPVVGDKLYGPDANLYIRFARKGLSEQERSRLVLPRQALHASACTVTLPDGHKNVTVRASLPDDIAALFPELPEAERFDKVSFGYDGSFMQRKCDTKTSDYACTQTI